MKKYSLNTNMIAVGSTIVKSSERSYILLGTSRGIGEGMNAVT